MLTFTMRTTDKKYILLFIMSVSIRNTGLNTRERNAWTAASAVAAAAEAFSIYMVLSSTSFSIQPSSWISSPEYVLSASLGVSIMSNLASVTLLRGNVFKLMENAQNPYTSLQRIVWYPTAFVTLSSSVLSMELAIACCALFVDAGALLMLAQILSRPMIARDMYTREISTRSVPLVFALLSLGLPMALLLRNAANDLEMILAVAVTLDFLIQLFASCARPTLFIASQYGFMLVLVSSQAALCLSAASTFGN